MTCERILWESQRLLSGSHVSTDKTLMADEITARIPNGNIGIVM
jgi:hypothetical protein